MQLHDLTLVVEVGTTINILLGMSRYLYIGIPWMTIHLADEEAFALQEREAWIEGIGFVSCDEVHVYCRIETT
jgi:hypothetical protein